MAELLSVLPDPVSLIESMRAIGYTPETALADLIDNSISADANVVFVEYDASAEPFVAVLDNGHGMDAAELTNAMRHGSRNPAHERAAHDLGRFGLGLKTASLSQCRRLTVISKQGGQIHARCWDLDVVQREEDWVVVVPSPEERSCLPLYDTLITFDNGTLVVWEELDRLMSGAKRRDAEMKIRMSGLHRHLSFVFHRFAKREGGCPAIDIRVNGLKLSVIDPYLRENCFTQPLECQDIRLGDDLITVQPYVLPHMSQLSHEEAETAGGRDGLRGSQGFYVYRNRRLVIWGTWFRLVPKEEFYKLTRVQVDIPNSLDHLWALDIKKSAAYPPDIIRDRLRDLIPHFARTSRTAITYPGRRQKHAQGFVPLWERIEPQHGHFRYQLNLEHPVIRKVADALAPAEQSLLQQLIDMIATALPLESIYSDMCGDSRPPSSDSSYDAMLALTSRILDATGLPLNNVLCLDPLARFPEHHDRIRKDLHHA